MKQKVPKTNLEKWLENRADVANKKARERADSADSAPCEVCGNKQIVRKYRKVHGNVDGQISGSFLWGTGDMHGSIHGETITDKILACSECGNERLVEEWDYKTAEDIFWDDMFAFYQYIDNQPYPTAYDERLIQEFRKLPYIDDIVATRKFMLDSYNSEYSFYNDMKDWEVGTWAKAGFKVKKNPAYKKRFLLFFVRTVPATWPEWFELMPEEELKKLSKDIDALQERLEERQAGGLF